MLKSSAIIGGFLAVSLLANVGILLNYWMLQETVSLVPRLKKEVAIVASVIPREMNREEVFSLLQSGGYNVQIGGEYYSAPRPNESISVSGTSFIFSPSGSLIQINSLGDSLQPIYESHNKSVQPTADAAAD